MPEENNKENAVQAAKQRNIANNTNNVRVAADVATKTANPYAKAAGLAVKATDKMSGGKASEKIGKAMDSYMKSQGLKGKMMQAALNKMSESGTTNRIASAMNAKNGKPGTTPKMGGMGGLVSQDTMTSVKDKNEGESNDSGTATFSGNFKIVKYGLIGLAVIFPVIICCLLVSSSQIFLNSISLGTADSLTGDEVDKKINKKMENPDENFNNEIKDEDLQAYHYDKYISDSKSKVFKNNKLYNANIVQTANIFTVFKRKYNEATLDRIEEFFPAVIDESKNYDENMVYDFYFKMYNLYITYKNQYNVRLDLPLLMATLNLQSSDKNVVFSSNMDARYRTTNINDIPKNELDYYYSWANYKVSRNVSEHDMEVLAQHMVSRKVKEQCKDADGNTIEGKVKIIIDDEIPTQTLFCDEGEFYSIEILEYFIDNERYIEFLKQFLEKKYYIEGESSLEISDNSNNSNNLNSGGSSSSGQSSENCSLIVQGNNYYKTVIPQTESCSVSGFYDDNPWGLEPNFYKNILALISDAKLNGCDASIISGHRTYAKQAYFYDCYITKKCNNGNLAAEPGYSNHEYGIAADLMYSPYSTACLNYYHTNAYRYGLNFPLLYASFPEDWHIEPNNIIKGRP